jgi:hypothetical protein
VAHIINEDWLAQGNNKFINLANLTKNLFFIFLTNALISPSMWLINFNMITLKFFRGRLVSDGDLDREIVSRTQRELNKIFENPDIDFSNKFAYMSKTILMTMFFIPILPSGVILSGLGFCYAYVVEKYNLLRVYKRPVNANAEMVKHLIYYFKFFIFTYTVKPLIYHLDRELYIPQTGVRNIMVIRTDINCRSVMLSSCTFCIRKVANWQGVRCKPTYLFSGIF